MNIEYFKSNVTNRWHVRIRGVNGEKMLTSEVYSQKSNAKRAARKLWLTITDPKFTVMVGIKEVK